MMDLTIAGAVATFNYVDDQTNNALSSYAKHRFETAADYITNGAWRKLFNKANEKLKDKTIQQDPNLEFIDEILEKTKLQTDDILLDLWASLLANAMQGKNFIRREYFDIITKLNPCDVLVLAAAMDEEYRAKIIEAEKFSNNTNLIITYLFNNFLNKKYKIIDKNEIILSLSKLREVGIFTEKSNFLNFSLTPLGLGLQRALSAD
ncbi:Abi-alpha family protein [Acetobacter indonesiensis]|uniref:Abi-alpha family protein n=1 Tax=Acetobacter indonesiensis TaxID=104101 RepID=UPI0020A5C01B|nr:Abi-alpha family protein [Acetobacter indonesiensis]MCP1231737.1 DUF4393 domain-containing protein [Acetobacter indonesiensis]